MCSKLLLLPYYVQVTCYLICEKISQVARLHVGKLPAPIFARCGSIIRLASRPLSTLCDTFMVQSVTERPRAPGWRSTWWQVSSGDVSTPLAGWRNSCSVCVGGT